MMKPQKPPNGRFLIKKLTVDLEVNQRYDYATCFLKGNGMSDLEERARIFAMKAHEGQIRWNKAGTLLTTHLEEVVSLVRESGGSDDELASAWLHDVIEDTPVLLTEVARNFGDKIFSIVFGLTDPPSFKNLHTLERKIAQAERIRFLSDSVKRVKIADQTSNVRSIATDPPVKWDTKRCLDYIEGARQIVFECQEVSEFLFGKFCEAYQAAIKVRKIPDTNRA